MITPEKIQARLAERAGRAAERAAGKAGEAARAGNPVDAQGGTVSPWRGTAPELIIAAVAVAATAAAGYAMAGWAGLSVVAVATAAVALVVLRALLPQLTPDEAKKAREKRQARALSGYSRRRFVVHNAMTSQGFYDSELRPVLEHLLAARLSERHGVHLYADPAAARRLVCRSPRDAELWRWIDPATRPETPPRGASDRAGIPRRTLARLIDRLEEL
jgi:hypothetical protein